MCIVDLEIVKLQIENIEVGTAINRPHHGNPFDEMMGESMSVALQHSVNRALRQRVDQLGDFVSLQASALLFCVLIPYSELISSVAVVSHVAEDQYCVGASRPQFFATIENDVCVTQKAVRRE